MMHVAANRTFIHLPNAISRVMQRTLPRMIVSGEKKALATSSTALVTSETDFSTLSILIMFIS